MLNKDITPLDIQSLVSEECEYRIPIYQRNYAWGAKEIEQLILDIIDYSKKNTDSNYYIGTLIVAAQKKDKNEYYDTIDGQQRLTTLNILSAVLKNEDEYAEIDMNWYKDLNLSFASREKSMNTLSEAYNGEFNLEECETNIKAAYTIGKKAIKKLCKENNISIKIFADYLFKSVKILRVPLPKGTDLNHYFEIMNSRGEQLEKHEVLKANLMACFNHLDTIERLKYESSFHKIWEACSNMEKYLQYGFEVEERHLIFGRNDWNNIVVDDFDELCNHLINNDKPTEKITTSLRDIIANPEIPESDIKKRSEKKDDSPDRFYSLIDFPNFLLHVLKVSKKSKEISLDDKNLITAFEPYLKQSKEENLAFVKTFIYDLLKCKFLFDKYIIKREYTSKHDGWSLQKLEHYSSGKTLNAGKYTRTFQENNTEDLNHKALMLLAMFHVSLPSMSYKYWINASLNYLFYQIEIEAADYVNYLEYTAKNFVYDRHLAIGEAADYNDIIYTNKPKTRKPEDINLEKLNYHHIQNNLVFNYIDYLLWLKYKAEETKVNSFKFTARNSVEHFYPQNPENDSLPKLEEKELHSIGNLCLISHSKNSRYSNLTPLSKLDQVREKENLESIKQFLMMKDPVNWKIPAINKHNDEIIQLLKDHINANYTGQKEVSKAAELFRYARNKKPTQLVQALIGFGDYPKHTSGSKYNFLDFEQMRSSKSFKLMETYIEENNLNSLNEVINHHLENKTLEESYRYLFIKYPDAINYCQQGKIIFKQQNQVFLLKHYNNNINVSKELYSFLLRKHFKKEYGIKIYQNKNQTWIDISFDNGAYYLTEEYPDPHISLVFNNEKGEYIKCILHNHSINGNSSIIKNLAGFKWSYNKETGYYQRKQSDSLFKLKNNVNDNLETYIKKVKSILKNGFGIKLK